MARRSASHPGLGRLFLSLLLSGALLVLPACAARQKVPPEQQNSENSEASSGTSASDDRDVLRFDPVLVHPAPPEEASLSELNAEELMALGRAASAELNFERASQAFGRVADVWPDSPEAQTAAFQAGIALEKLGRFLDAGNRFAAVADARRGHGESLEAAFHLATALYHLEDYERAEALLALIANRSDLEHDQLLTAFVHRAVCQVELGKLDVAEEALKRALAFWQLYRNEEPFDSYIPAQAQFFLGEISRLRFEEVKLDASQEEDELAKALEKKCRLLLEAQGRYLIAIRMNQSHWATSAGYRVGALYERLYDEMVSAEPPPGMTDEEREIYREEVLARVRVLITKALPIYEQTLAAAERTGTQTPFVEKARAGLERLRSILTQEAEAPSAKAKDEDAGEDAPSAQNQNGSSP